MHRSRFLQFLSIPAALGLGTALVLACNDGVPTAPNPEFKKGANKGNQGPAEYLDDTDGACKSHYTLIAAPAGSPSRVTMPIKVDSSASVHPERLG
jgi:hypothetical protein